MDLSPQLRGNREEGEGLTVVSFGVFNQTVVFADAPRQ